MASNRHGQVPHDTKSQKPLTVRLTREQHDWATIRASALGCSLAQFLRLLLHQDKQRERSTL